MISRVFLFFAWTIYGCLAQRCPAPEELSPSCMCRQFDTYSMMACNNIMSSEELIPPIKATEGFDMLALSIHDSSLMYIPHDLFKNTKFSKIRFENTQLMALSDDELAFVGLEDHLEEIRATGAFYITTWDWSQLRNHQRMDLIDVNNIGMHSLDNEFPNLQKLTALGISHAQLSFLHPNAFVNLPSLRLLILKHNDLAELSRSMFPSPADNMYHIDLSDNQLAILPDDLFDKMPNLQEVLLKENKLISLKEESFSGIFKRLQMLELRGNEIRCDCRLRWLVGHRTPLYFDGECYEPTFLRGSSLRYLKHNDLQC